MKKDKHQQQAPSHRSSDKNERAAGERTKDVSSNKAGSAGYKSGNKQDHPQDNKKNLWKK
ncbi:MAG: hypothetical protein ACXVAX_10620 [Pseudobdellovibrio sp.]